MRVKESEEIQIDIFKNITTILISEYFEILFFNFAFTFFDYSVRSKGNSFYFNRREW